MIDPIIEHQTQTLINNCVSASLSMVLRKDIETVVNEFHQAYLDGKMEIWDYLNSHGVEYRRCLAAETALKQGHIYMMNVPSLNLVAETHSIIIETSDCGTLWFIFDPNEGREGVKVYGNDFDIKSWSPDFEFRKQDLLNYWNKQ